MQRLIPILLLMPITVIFIYCAYLNMPFAIPVCIGLAILAGILGIILIIVNYVE